MITLITGLFIGALCTLPLIPLLRVTDPAFGRAAAGIALVGVVLFAITFYVQLVDRVDVPFARLLVAVYTAAKATGSALALAAVVAIVGVFTPRFADR